MEYKWGRANLMPDELSHKGELANINQAQSNLRDALKKGSNVIYLPKPSSTLSRKVRQGDLGGRWLDSH